jgi:stage V sporulation protein S
MEKEILKISGKTAPGAIAGAIAGIVRERKPVEMQAIGAGAVNQAIKGAAIARGFVAPSGVDLVVIPYFDDLEIDGETRTAIKLIVEAR